jgi:2-oxo-4-hydroxy-4-carboxy-5-ureidoimidazoline decarboxylase
MTLGELNALEPSRAYHELLRCCGSSRWAAAMTAARPFETVDAMQTRASAMWSSLGREDWLEAFSAHPKIGEQRNVSAWSEAEQAGMQSADSAARTRLAVLNEQYEARFGYIFIVCATGKSPAEMLSMLEGRLPNDADRELPIAAEEQRKITALRLAKLVDA